MEFAMGAMRPLFPKLLQLIEDKYVEQKGLRGEVESLSREMLMVHATLEEVSRVPPDQLSKPDKLWAGMIRELSYDMEDAVDAFMVRVARREAVAADTNVFQKIASKATSSIKKIWERHRISDQIKGIKNLSKELSELRTRYAFNRQAPPSDGVDPRVINLFKNEGRELVGIKEARDQLIHMLMHPPEDQSLRIITIVGCGGVGKTTLAKLVHDQLKSQSSFDCCAFVSVGRHPNIANTLREMYEKLLGKNCSSDMTSWSAERCCEKLRPLLEGKRYNIVVDDVWDERTWETFNCILPDNNCSSKVIMTTRNSEVGARANDVHKLQPLSHEMSKELFHKRTCSSRNDNGGNSQLVDKIVGKCDGVPLSIIAIASLLADRPLEDWQKVYESLVSGREKGDSTSTILLYSYYDLPSYLRPCLLYLSMYPEDSFIEKSTLVRRWIGEGFVQLEKEGGSLLEIGERYFNELMNRSMIQPEESILHPGIIVGCRVHDIVLDLIRDLAEEENFVTVLDDKKFASSDNDSSRTLRKKELGHSKVRRISIQCVGEITQDTIGGMPEVVRTLDQTTSRVVSCDIDRPLLSSLQACRVLVLSSNVDIEHLGKLLHLRHLEFEVSSDNLKVPKAIGNLKSLQTLLITGVRMKELPPAVCGLTQLVCLHAPRVEEFPVDMIGNLVHLEDLKLELTGNKAVNDFVSELRKLMRLRVLDIEFHGPHADEDSWVEALMQSLNNLQEIRELYLRHRGRSMTSTDTWKMWKPPRHLWILSMRNVGLSPELMDPSLFQRLRYLCLDFKQVDAVDVGNLALLPQLVYLELGVPRPHERCNIIFGADGFKNLRVCDCSEAETNLKFLQGASPQLESLHLNVCPESDLTDLGLQNLVSLKEITVSVQWHGYTRRQAEETEAVLRHAVQGHPNRPSFQTRGGVDVEILLAFLSERPLLL